MISLRVLSIKEPYASLLKDNIKHIETRSWKTNYRGEIYIHASKGIDNDYLKKDELDKYVNKDDFKCGYIIAKANLVDCIYMDDEFLNKIKKDKLEYLCGDYRLGRYAWVLEDIKPISPIPAKGHLGIWNYNE